MRNMYKFITSFLLLYHTFSFKILKYKPVTKEAQSTENVMVSFVSQMR